MQILLSALLAVAEPGNMGLLQAALNPNPDLRSYIATAELVARTHPVPLKRTFHGTAYYVTPTRKIVFDQVTGLLSHFQSLTTNTPSWSQAEKEYTITPSADDGKTATFTLVATKSGSRVTSLVLSVDDGAALVSRVVYHYTDGSLLRFDQRYQTISGFHLPTSIDISAHFPGYSVDGTIRFTQYQTNVAVPKAIFGGANAASPS